MLRVAQACIVAALGDRIVRCRCGRQTSEEQREHEDVAHLLSPHFASSNMRQKRSPLNSKGATRGKWGQYPKFEGILEMMEPKKNEAAN